MKNKFLMMLAVSVALVAPAQAGVKSFLVKTTAAAAIGFTVLKDVKAHYDDKRAVNQHVEQSSSSDCSAQMPLGMPTGEVFVLCRDDFMIGYDLQRKVPSWVMQKLDADQIVGEEEREDRFTADDELPVNARAEDKDYAWKAQGSVCRDNPGNLEYCNDRGHVAPAADFKSNPKAMKQSFKLSNVAPQNAQFNRGLWKRLESRVRYWARERGTIYVTSGTLFERDMGYVGKRVMVPSHFYKIIIDTNRSEAIAFVMPNEAVRECVERKCTARDYDAMLPQYRVTIKNIEQRSGRNFNPKLSGETAAYLESEKAVWKSN